MRVVTTTSSEKKDGIRLLIDQLIDAALNKEAFNYNKMLNMFEEMKIIFSEPKFDKLKITISECKTNDEMEQKTYTSKLIITPN